MRETFRSGTVGAAAAKSWRDSRDSNMGLEWLRDIGAVSLAADLECGCRCYWYFGKDRRVRSGGIDDGDEIIVAD